MKTMRKEDMDRAAWGWADSTDPKYITKQHVELAYRIKLDFCRPNSCRRNCRGNPRCLSGLGESKWLGPKAAAAAEDAWSVRMFDPNEERREAGMFVGLTNLGATCYVNSLLQLWFHNLKFRRAVYLWSPEEDPQEMANITLQRNEGKDYTPKSSIGHLQLLFALLQFGKRRCVDPTAFIASLGLDTTTQQDAQEFSKLFVSMLEERLSHQSSPLVRKIINEQFCGKYSYVTKCQQCGTESALQSLFYELELNIAGHKTLADCLEEFLKEEKLEGADRYHCTVCKSKQDATRSIKLDVLPPVLNLQLMRFVFDRQKGSKKKLNSFLQFPENLDMSLYLKKPNGSLLYVLSAVLIHRGHSAFSGHYVAHICDSTSSTWYKFNDETVEKMEGKKLKLGTEEDIDDGNKKSKPQRVPKGFLVSNNAYMLVYSEAKQEDEQNSAERKGTEPGARTDMEWNLPERLNGLLKTEDQKFEDWVKEFNETKAVTAEIGKARQQEMVNLYNMLPVMEDAPYEFITSDWLVKWLNNEVKPVDNSSIVCPHGKLSPDSLPQTKCINSVAADVLYSKFGGGPRLLGDVSLCLPCVKHRCNVIRLKNKTAEDNRRISALLKAKVDRLEPTFWVGKNSLRCWRKLVLEERAGVKVEADSEETSGSYLSCMEKAVGLCSSNDHKMSCDSIADTCGENISDEEKALEQDCQKIPIKCKVYSGDKTECESSSVSINSEECESNVAVATRSRSKIASKSDNEEISLDLLEARTSESLPISSCNTSIDNSQVSSCDDIRNVRALPPDLRRKCMSDANNSDNESETLESEVSSTVPSEFEGSQNVKSLHLTVCNNRAVTSSDEVSASCLLDCKMKLSEVEISVPRQEVAVSKNYFTNNNNNNNNNNNKHISGNSESQIFTENGVKVLEPEPSYVRIRTPGFGDDIIHSVAEDVVYEMVMQKSSKQPQDVPCESGGKVQESREESEVKTVSDLLSGDSTVDDETLHNEQQLEDQKQDDNILCKDSDGQEDDDDDNDDDDEGFNDDIICTHGHLCVEESRRRLVPRQVWDIFRSYFPSAKPFTQDAKPCVLCQNLLTQGKAARDVYRQTAAIQKDSLLDLYYDRNRVLLGNSASLQRQKQLPHQVLHLVCRDFIDAWRRFIRDPNRKDPESCIVNESLLCSHGGLLYDPASSDESGSSNKFVVVTASEWDTLRSFYSVDHDVTVRRDPTMSTLICQPGICEECVLARIRVEELELLQYEKATIFVRKIAVNGASNDQLKDSGKSSSSSSTLSECKDDPEYQACDAKRPKLAPSSCSTLTPGVPAPSGDVRIRKSTRHRRVRGEKELSVSSKLTLLELKVMVMKLFHVAPFDQHLSVDGRDLVDNNATLGSLQVYPHSVILLKADEASEDPSQIDEYMSTAATIEEGFKGTELLK